MSTVFFKITSTQENEIKKFMKDEGYTSKSEFFRFLVKYYKYQKEDSARAEVFREAEELSALLAKLNSEGKLKDNLDSSLADL